MIPIKSWGICATSAIHTRVDTAYMYTVCINAVNIVDK